MLVPQPGVCCSVSEVHVSLHREKLKTEFSETHSRTDPDGRSYIFQNISRRQSAASLCPARRPENSTKTVKCTLPQRTWGMSHTQPRVPGSPGAPSLGAKTGPQLWEEVKREAEAHHSGPSLPPGPKRAVSRTVKYFRNTHIPGECGRRIPDAGLAQGPSTQAPAARSPYRPRQSYPPGNCKSLGPGTQRPGLPWLPDSRPHAVMWFPHQARQGVKAQAGGSAPATRDRRTLGRPGGLPRPGCSGPPAHTAGRRQDPDSSVGLQV